VDSESIMPVAMWNRFCRRYYDYGDWVFGGAGRAAGGIVQTGTDVKYG